MKGRWIRPQAFVSALPLKSTRRAGESLSKLKWKAVMAAKFSLIVEKGRPLFRSSWGNNKTSSTQRWDGSTLDPWCHFCTTFRREKKNWGMAAATTGHLPLHHESPVTLYVLVCRIKRSCSVSKSTSFLLGQIAHKLFTLSNETLQLHLSKLPADCLRAEGVGIEYDFELTSHLNHNLHTTLHLTHWLLSWISHEVPVASCAGYKAEQQPPNETNFSLQQSTLKLR